MIASDTLKRCTTCRAEKPLDEYYRDKRRGGYRASCKECCRAADKSYHAENREQRLQQRKEYRDRNPELAIQRSRAYYAAHRDEEIIKRREYYRAHREEQAAYSAERRQDPAVVQAQRERCLDHYYRNKPAYTAAVARRRARKLGNGYEKYDRLAIYERDAGTCHLCGEHVDLADFSIDHIIPISKGGPDTPSNVATSHLSCNKSRGTKPVANRGGI
jgi:5-methylcytosine-specific restriction endonuclease McrA